MSRTLFVAGLAAGLTLAATTARAQPPGHLPRIASAGAKPVKSGASDSSSAGRAAVSLPVVQQPGYVKLSAPMYPVPVPYVPHQVGGAMITNQALYPQEMLYPHEYTALYPPYYYKVKGGWVLTPWGVREVQRYKLKGTKVNVEYESHISPFALFIPPSTRTHHSNYGQR